MKNPTTFLSITLCLMLLVSPLAAAKAGSGITFTKGSTGGFSFGSRTITRTRSSTATNTNTNTDTDTATDSSTSTGNLLQSINAARTLNTAVLRTIDTSTSRQDRIASKKARHVMRSLANSPVDEVKEMIRAISSSTNTSSSDVLDLLN